MSMQGTFGELGTPLAATAESIVVSTTAIPLTTIPGNANGAFVTVETASIRVWVDGTTPTATAGHLYDVGAAFTLLGPMAVRGCKMIRAGGADATVRVSYFSGL